MFSLFCLQERINVRFHSILHQFLSQTECNRIDTVSLTVSISIAVLTIIKVEAQLYYVHEYGHRDYKDELQTTEIRVAIIVSTVPEDIKYEEEHSS